MSKVAGLRLLQFPLLPGIASESQPGCIHPYRDQSIPQRNTQTFQWEDISTYIMQTEHRFLKYQAIAGIQKYSTSSVADYMVHEVLLSLCKLSYRNTMLLGNKKRSSTVSLVKQR